MGNLTDKQRVFVHEYITCWNATEAARRAGYRGNNATLAAIGSENLRKPNIAECIESELSSKIMSADEALARMSEIARGEWSSYIETSNGKPARLNVERMIDDGKTHLIKGIVPTSNGTRYDFPDMQGALETIMRHLGIMVDRKDITTNGESLNAIEEERVKLLAKLEGALGDDDGE